MKFSKVIKRVVSIAVAGAMIISVTACSSKESTAGTGNPGEGAKKIGVLLSGTRDDYGYNQALYEFAVGLEDVLDVQVLIKESVPEDSSSQSVMEQMVAQGCGIVFATSYGHLEYAEEVAKMNPNVAFFATNPSVTEGIDNICVPVANVWDAAYVDGIAAGLMTKTNEIGFIGSFQMPLIISSINAFTLGVQSVNPDANVRAVFTGSWGDVGLQTNAINGMASQNIDTIAQYQDYTKTIVETCEAQGINVIGYHVDTVDLAPNTYISGTIDVFDFHTKLIKDTIEGNFHNGVQRGGYKEGVIGNSEGGDFVPDAVKAQVSEAIAKMKSGEFTTFTGPIKKQDGTIAVEEGEILEDSVVDFMDYFVEGVIGLTE